MERGRSYCRLRAAGRLAFCLPKTGGAAAGKPQKNEKAVALTPPAECGIVDRTAVLTTMRPPEKEKESMAQPTYIDPSVLQWKTSRP